MTSIDQEILSRLRRFDTPTICNVIELFDIRPRTAGYMDGRIRACFADLPPMVGFAATATFRASVAPRGKDVYASTEEQIERFDELSGPPVIVIQDLDVPTVAATFGEVMCSIYQTFGAQGIVVSGAGRDLDQVRALGFPTFTGGTICSHGDCHIVQTQVPVQVGGLVVYPDDLLHGDRNGVTTIPAVIASEVAAIADEFVATEQIIFDALRDTTPSLARLREARAESKARVAALRTRVSRGSPQRA